VAEAFLALRLGGGYEPVGDDFGGSSIVVPHGEQEIPGLADALARGGAAPANATSVLRPP